MDFASAKLFEIVKISSPLMNLKHASRPRLRPRMPARSRRLVPARWPDRIAGVRDGSGSAGLSVLGARPAPQPLARLRPLVPARAGSIVSSALEVGPSGEWVHRPACVFHVGLDWPTDQIARAHDRPAQQASLPVHVFGSRNQRQINAALLRIGIYGCRHSVVGQDQSPDRVRCFDDVAHVHNFKGRVRDAFKEDQFGVGPDRRVPCCVVGPRQQRVISTPKRLSMSSSTYRHDPKSARDDTT